MVGMTEIAPIKAKTDFEQTRDADQLMPIEKRHALIRQAALETRNPLIHIFHFFVSKELLTEQTLPQIINGARCNFPLNPTNIGLAITHERSQGSNEELLSNLTLEQARAAMEEVNAMSQRAHKMLELKIESDQGVMSSFNFLHRISRLAADSRLRKPRRKYYHEAARESEEKTATHFGFSSPEELRAVLTDRLNPIMLRVRSFFSKQVMHALDQDSPFRVAEPIGSIELIREIFAFSNNETKQILKEIVLLNGRLPYGFDIEYSELPLKKRSEHLPDLRRMAVLPAGQVDQIELKLAQDDKPKGEINQLLTAMSQLGVNSSSAFYIDNRQIKIQELSTDKAYKFEDNTYLTIKEQLDILIESLFVSTVDLADARKIDKALTLKTRLEILEEINRLGHSLFWDSYSSEAGRTLDIPLANAHRFQSDVRHLQPKLNSPASIAVFLDKERLTDAKQLGWGHVLRYAQRAAYFEGAEVFMKAGSFGINKDMLHELTSWKMGLEIALAKLARAFLSFQSMAASSWHELTGETPFMQLEGASPLIGSLPTVLMSQLRPLFKPNFLVLGNPMSQFNELRLVKNLVTYPGDGTGRRFANYLLPQGIDGEKTLRLVSPTPAEVGKAIIGGNELVDVARLHLPQYAQAINVSIRLKGKKDQDFLIGKDFRLQYDSGGGYYRIVFTQAGSAKLGNIRAIHIDAEFVTNKNDGFERPERVKFLTTRQINKISELVPILRDAGYQRISQEIEHLVAQDGKKNRKKKIDVILQQIGVPIGHTEDQEALTTSDIEQAIKKGSRYTFKKVVDWESLALGMGTVRLPKPDRNGYLAAQCTHFATLQALIFNYIFDNTSEVYKFHPSSVLNALNLGFGVVSVAGGHSDTRGGNSQKAVDHDAQPGVTSSAVDLFYWLGDQFSKIRQSYEKKPEKPADDQIEPKALEMQELASTSLNWQRPIERTPLDKRQILFDFVIDAERQFVKALTDSAHFDIGRDKIPQDYIWPKFVTMTGGVFRKLAQLARTGEFDNLTLRSEMIARLKVAYKQWLGISQSLYRNPGDTAPRRKLIHDALGVGEHNVALITELMGKIITLTEQAYSSMI